MSPETVLMLARQGLETMILTAAPLLGSILIVGLGISLLQALTQINEQTLSFVPKLVVTAVVLVVAGPWMLATLTDFLQRTLNSIPGLVDGRLL